MLQVGFGVHNLSFAAHPSSSSFTFNPWLKYFINSRINLKKKNWTGTLELKNYSTTSIFVSEKDVDTYVRLRLLHDDSGFGIYTQSNLVDSTEVGVNLVHISKISENVNMETETSLGLDIQQKTIKLSVSPAIFHSN